MNIRRIEAGILDRGGDFDTSITPFEARLSKCIELEKTDFIGKNALLTAKPGTHVYGLICNELTPRARYRILDGNIQVGYVTTGAYSPYVKAGIGYVRFDQVGEWTGRSLLLQSLDSETASCEIVELPFYDHEKAIPKGQLVHEWPRS